MYAITAAIRKSRAAGRPGSVIFRIRDREGRERLVATGLRTDPGELTTLHREPVLRGLKCLYELIARACRSGAPCDVDLIAREFREELQRGLPPADLADFRVNRRIVSVGKPFNTWVRYATPADDSPTPTAPLTAERLPSFVADLIDTDQISRRGGTRHNYKSAASALEAYLQARPERHSQAIGRDFVRGFHRWLERQGNAPSTAAFYTRMLRAILNKAKGRGLLPAVPADWFSGIASATAPATPRDTTPKALDKEELNRLADLPLAPGSLDELARDLFIFSFLTRGMELVDILNLTPANLRGDHIEYRKRLTGRPLTVRLDTRARLLLDRYTPASGSYFTVPFARHTKSREYATRRRLVALRLAALGEALRLPFPLVFSSARATWTALTRESDLPSLLLNH